MQRFFTFGLLASCLLAGPAAAAARPSIPLCFERQEVLPWRTLDGSGLNFELLNEVARRSGIDFDYQSMPWKRCLAQLKANQVVGAFSVSFNAERQAFAAYPGGRQADPNRRMHIDSYVLARRVGTKVDWDGKAFHDLDGRIGIQLGYSVGDFLRARNVPVDEGSQRADELVEKLLAGRVAAAALGGATAKRLMRNPAIAGKIEVRPVPLVEKPYYLLLSRQFVATDPALAERIWKNIEAVRNSPAYRRREQELTGGGSH